MFARLLKAVLVVAMVGFAIPVQASDRGTAAEAQALVTKAVALYKSAGREAALAAFADPKGEFMPKDLFIFVQDLNGNMVQHAKNPGFNGKNLSNLKDTDGKLFVAAMTKVAAESGSGWVDYKFVNPATKKIEPKSSYVERVDDLFIGCGIYKSQ